MVAVGQAAARFSTDWAIGFASLPTVEEMRSFVRSYESRRRRRFDPDERTATTSHIPVTPDQFALLVALATPVIRDDPLPTNRQTAASLEWTVTKFNRKLDGLCAKYSKAGVAGLHGSSDRLAKDRRTRLAEHVVEAGIVTQEHVDAAST